MTRLRVRLAELRAKIRTILYREAIVLDLVKASFPLYAGLGLAMTFGFGYIVWDGHREDIIAKERSYEICTNRNSQSEQSRLDNVTTVEETVAQLSDPTLPEMVALIERIDVTQHAKVAKVDTDCNGDGVLDSLDYSEPLPPNLPLIPEPEPPKD